MWIEKVILAGERVGDGRGLGVPIAATDNELITRDGGVGARNAGADGIETRSTVGRKPADKNFKKRPVSFVTGYTDWEGVVAAIIAAADNNRKTGPLGERLERLKFVTSHYNNIDRISAACCLPVKAVVKFIDAIRLVFIHEYRQNMVLPPSFSRKNGRDWNSRNWENGVAWLTPWHILPHFPLQYIVYLSWPSPPWCLRSRLP